MKMSAKGIAFLRDAEGCKLTAYKDGGGVWTIGVGHIEGVKPGQTISQFEADEMLAMDLEDREIRLSQILKGVPTSQCEFDALLSLVFNIGFGDPNHKPKPIPGLLTSTVLKRHKLGNKTGAANAFAMWNRDNGKVVAGLTRRRERERKLYLGEA
jgi:lysozyme